MIVQLALFTQLASTCAPHVAVETLAAVARTESGLDALAIHDNTSGATYKPASREEAIALATELTAGVRHSVDLGLMQINSLNLPSLGLTVTDAFDPCRSMAGADQVLVRGYAAPAAGGDEQEALHQALSRYNTGNPVRGIQNGYVNRVQASAEVVVPAIRLRGDAATPLEAGPLGGGASIAVQPLPPPPASWDVYGQARAAKGQGAVSYSPNRTVVTPSVTATIPPAASAPVLGRADLAFPSAPVPVTPAASALSPGEPVMLQPATRQQAANDYR